MVTFVAYRYGSTPNPPGFFAPADPSTVFTENSPTHFVATGVYDRLVVSGEGFTFDGAGRPTGGTITAIDVTSFGSLPQYLISDLSLAVTDLMAVTTFDYLSALMVDIFSGNDRLKGSPLGDDLHGFGGRDIINGRGEGDTLFGGNGRDRIKGGDGTDFVEGGRGRDRLDGGADMDMLSFADRSAGVVVKLKGAEWTEARIGGRVEDQIRKFESIQGGQGNNKLIGDGGANVLRSYDGDDVLKGRGGDDEFRSGKGLDKLTGGGGADLFYFREAPDAGTVKTIKDFRPGTDKLALSFSGLGTLVTPFGPLDATFFHRGPGAADANDHLIYNPGNGRVYVDYDGVGGANQVLLAKLDAGLNLSSGDFFSYLL